MIIPWTMWKMYGDTAVLDRHFGAMTRWMDFLERANPDYLRARELGNSYNDWLAPGNDDTPHDRNLVPQYQDLDVLRRAAAREQRHPAEQPIISR